MLSKVPTLYFYSLKHFVQQMDLTVSSLDKMCHLRLLPPAIMSDIYREVKSISFLTWKFPNENETFDTKKKLPFFFTTNLDLCCCS